MPTRKTRISFRFHGKLLNLRRVRAKTKISRKVMKEFQYVNDNAVTTQAAENLQSVLDASRFAYKQFGLRINAKKTQVLYQHSPKDEVKTPSSICLEDTPLENVENFSYLGSTVSSSANSEVEVNRRIQ